MIDSVKNKDLYRGLYIFRTYEVLGKGGGGAADNVNILLSGHFCMPNKRFVELTDKSLSFVDLTDYVRLPAAYN